MKTHISIILLALMGLSLVGCPEGFVPDDGDYESPELFDELIIEYYEGGGMLPKSQRIYICADSAYNEVYDFGDKQRVNWKPEQEDLHTLYRTLRANKFDKIKADADRGEVFDRGGPIIDITVNSTRFQLNNNGNSFIREEWREEFYAIEKAILDYAAKQ